jgi:hypothetical protein
VVCPGNDKQPDTRFPQDDPQGTDIGAKFVENGWADFAPSLTAAAGPHGTIRDPGMEFLAQ